MIHEKIEGLLQNARKANDKVGVQVLSLIKAELTNREKEVGFKGWDDGSETKVLMKMAAQRKDSIEQYTAGGRPELAKAEQAELDYLEQFIPKQPTEEEVAAYTQEVIDAMKANGEEISMKIMKNVLTKVQEKYSMANGKIVSQVVKANS